MEHQYFAACPKGLEILLAEELETFACDDLRQTVAGVYFNASLESAYRACLWTRLANKILMPLARFQVSDADALYDGVKAVDWHEHINPNSTILVDFIGTDDIIRNSQFGALKVKDAIVDRIREVTGARRWLRLIRIYELTRGSVRAVLW